MSNRTECDREGTNQTAAQSFPTVIASLGLGIASMIALINFSVLLIFLKSKSVRANRNHNLVIFLSISDLTLGVSGVMSSCRLLIPLWTGAFIPCITSVVLFVVAIFMSLFQAFLISFHRFLVAVGSPWNNRLFQGKRKYVIYVISWSCVMAWAFAFVSPTRRGDVKVCNAKEIYGGNFHVFFCVYGAVGIALLTLTILLYSVTVNNVRKRYMKTFAWQMKNGQSEAGHSKTANSNENNFYITEIGKRKVFESLKVVGIIIALLVLFTCPFVVFMFMAVFNFGISHSSIFVVCVLAGLNSVINPFVYNWKIDPLRKEFKMLFRVCSRE